MAKGRGTSDAPAEYAGGWYKEIEDRSNKAFPGAYGERGLFHASYYRKLVALVSGAGRGGIDTL